jgi:hypothetical protein
VNQPSQDTTSPPWLSGVADFGGELELDLRDYLFCLGMNLDVESQLIAIRGLLAEMHQADEAFTEGIRQIEEHAKKVNGILNERAVDEWLDRVHHSVYQGAAHSMAAVGMLAPLIESLFFQCFQGIGRKFFPASHPKPSHLRWRSRQVLQWDCHFAVNGGRPNKHLVAGILQMAEVTGLTARLPNDLEPTLSALFAYRNKMFHLGFEWPLVERLSFEKTIGYNKWPSGWFVKSTSGESPWIFYLSQEFITHCLATIDKVLDAFSEFVRDELLLNQK